MRSSKNCVLPFEVGFAETTRRRFCLTILGCSRTLLSQRARSGWCKSSRSIESRRAESHGPARAEKSARGVQWRPEEFSPRPAPCRPGLWKVQSKTSRQKCRKHTQSGQECLSHSYQRLPVPYGRTAPADGGLDPGGVERVQREHAHQRLVALPQIVRLTARRCDLATVEVTAAGF